MLLLNGVDPAKVTLCRQGLPHAPERPGTRSRGVGEPLLVAYLGRLSVTKGVETLVSAVLSRPSLNVRLDIFGIAQDKDGERIARFVTDASSRDVGIRLRQPIAVHEAAGTRAEYD